MVRAWEVVGVVATEEMIEEASGRSVTDAAIRLPSGIMFAALTIPGIQVAVADTPPERAQLSYKYLNYQDGQPGWERIGVNAQAVSILLPMAGEWSIEGSLTSDTVSGASPAFHSQRFRSGRMDEHRIGRDLKLTRYFSRGSLTVGVADSRESDYFSNAYFVSGSLSTEDKNTTLSVGLGKTDDRINVPEFGVNNESKKIRDAMLGITQVVTTRDIVQLALTYSEGHGYFSDPYKYRDHRPDSKYQTAILGRWNHHFPATGGTARLSYRFYTDSFNVKGHTAVAEYVQPLPNEWTITPIFRAHAQSAASFYLDPVYPPFPTIRPRDEIQSQDQRLSAFGGLSVGVKISKQLTSDLLIDAKYERYEQRSAWYPFGSGSPGIEPLKANIFQLGLTYSF